jgi:hypothetical protein
MTLHPAKVLLSAIGLCVGLALVLSSPAEAAKAGKHKRHVAAASTKARHSGTAYWGTDLVRRGPLYNGPEYLGDDPDPNIRFQLLRDITGRYGGGGD